MTSVTNYFIPTVFASMNLVLGYGAKLLLFEIIRDHSPNRRIPNWMFLKLIEENQWDRYGFRNVSTEQVVLKYWRNHPILMTSHQKEFFHKMKEISFPNSLTDKYFETDVITGSHTWVRNGYGKQFTEKDIQEAVALYLTALQFDEKFHVNEQLTMAKLRIGKQINAKLLDMNTTNECEILTEFFNEFRENVNDRRPMAVQKKEVAVRFYSRPGETDVKELHLPIVEKRVAIGERH